MTNREVAFHDSALAEINGFIAAHPPERGGALLGPIGQPVVSVFLPDPHGAVTGVTYTPSSSLRQLVMRTERANADLELKGIAHSHPGGYDHPSGGDHRAFADTLRKAPWLGRGIFPIVTSRVNPDDDDRHRILLDAGIMSVFVAEARVGGAVQVEPARPRVIPFQRDVAVLANQLGAAVETAGRHTEVDGTLYAAASLRDETTDVTALFPLLYPTAPPLVLLTARADARGTSPLSQLTRRIADGREARTVALPLPWSLNVDEQNRLTTALESALAAPGLRQPARPTVSPADSGTGDAHVARDGIRARLDGAVASSLRSARVLLVGLGSGGSQTAEALARASVEHFTLVDPDRVGPENLSRTVYQFSDIGTDKTQALAARLTAINPAVTARTVTAALDGVTDDDLAAMVKESDLVIAATDDPKAQLRLNHLAWTLGIPAVFGGVYARGQAGEVVFTVPGLEQVRCYRCATANRRQGHQAGDAGINYGTGQLNAEPALGADISHVVTASVKIAIGLLELSVPGGSLHSAGKLVATALGNGYQFLILSTVAGYDFFPRLFADAVGQHGYQSVWMSVEANPDCPTCGVSPLAADEFVTSGPNLAALRPVVIEEAAQDDIAQGGNVVPGDVTAPVSTAAEGDIDIDIPVAGQGLEAALISAPAIDDEVPGREPAVTDG